MPRTDPRVPGLRRLLGCLLLTAFTATACTSGGDDEQRTEDFTPAAAPAVELSLLESVPGPVRVGVVLTGAAARGEGTDVAALAAGARVAEFRLDRAGANRLDLDVVDDRGTAEGAVAATRQLLAGGVAGIVYASSGAHLDAALDVAAAADTAVLLPYDTRTAAAGDTAWHTGPSEEQVAARVSALLDDRGQRAPLVLSGEGAGEELALLADPARRASLTAGDALAGQVSAAAAALTAGTADALVVAASAETSAEAVAAVQGQVPSVPVVLGPSALAPAFSERLADLGAAGGATTAGQFFAVGPAVDDTSTSAGVVDFLAAVRLAAQDGALPALVGNAGFAEAGAATADTAGHDAVLALAAAATSAGSARPADVLQELRGLSVDATSGLAGPPLTFSSSQALADDGVGVLQATTRGPGRGVEGESPALSWFVLPLGDR